MQWRQWAVPLRAGLCCAQGHCLCHEGKGSTAAPGLLLWVFPFLLWGEPGPGVGMAAAQRNCVSLLCCVRCWEQQQLQKDGNWLLSFLEQLLLFWSCWRGIDFPSRTAKRGLPMFSLSKFSRWGVAHLALHTHSPLQHVLVPLVFLWMSQGMYSCAWEKGLPTLSESERDKEKGKYTSFTGQQQKWSRPGLVLHWSHSCSWCLNPGMTGTPWCFCNKQSRYWVQICTQCCCWSSVVSAYRTSIIPVFRLWWSGTGYCASAAVGTNPWSVWGP